MKTALHFALSVLAFSAVAAFGQGTINVGNGITATRFPIYGVDSIDPPFGSVVRGNSALSNPVGTNIYYGGLLQGTRYAIEFWAGPASATQFSEMTLLTTMTFRTATANALPAGLTATVNLPVPGVLPGSQAKLAVRAWDTFSGSSYAAAFYRAQGDLYLSGPLSGTAPNGDMYIGTNWKGESFNIFGVPEPSSLALVCLCATATLIFHRRK